MKPALHLHVPVLAPLRSINMMPGIILIILLSATILPAQVSDGSNNHVQTAAEDFEYATMTDPRDGQVYKIIITAERTSMIENLRYLPSVSPPFNCSETDPVYYVYNYNGSSLSAAREAEYFSWQGVLYNWPAAVEGGNNQGVTRGACPPGWHIPISREERPEQLEIPPTYAHRSAGISRWDDDAMEFNCWWTNAEHEKIINRAYIFSTLSQATHAYKDTGCYLRCIKDTP
jgi:hypothetical protein